MSQPSSTPNQTNIALAAALVAVAFLVSQCERGGDAPTGGLPSLGATIGGTTVSGISSGAYMAGQFQIAHSSIVQGAAIIAGGPYGCAESAFAGMVVGPAATMLNASKAGTGCMQNGMALWGVPNAGLLAGKTEQLARDNAIDPIESLTSGRVYLFSGKEDRTVVPAIVASANEFYRKVGVPSANIKYVSDLPAGHGFVTEAEGQACARSGEPYVVDCDYDQAKELLTHLYGPLSAASAAPAGAFSKFSQRAFAGDRGEHGLSDTGTVYVPAACGQKTCRVHIAFHGCAQNEDAVGDAFIKKTGFSRWADTNRLIVLFPQTEANAVNPQGCWDWWGYTGRDYLTKNAPQIRAVYLMLQQLAAPRGPAS
jgi:poly(3-hydroxybutyrate) depolymerase